MSFTSVGFAHHRSALCSHVLSRNLNLMLLRAECSMLKPSQAQALFNGVNLKVRVG